MTYKLKTGNIGDDFAQDITFYTDDDDNDDYQNLSVIREALYSKQILHRIISLSCLNARKIFATIVA